MKEHIYHPDPNVSLKALDQSWKLDGAYGEKPHVEVNILQFQEEARMAEEDLAEIAEKLGVMVEELKVLCREPNVIDAEAVGSS